MVRSCYLPDSVAKKHKGKGLAPSGAVLVQNRRAAHDYHVLERLEAGIALAGSEVKSIRDGKASLIESYGAFVGTELYLQGAHISEYEQAHRRNHEPVRRRKLLLHRKELDHLAEAVGQDGMTLIPLSLYLKDGFVKVELAVCKGKQLHDKRATLKERELKREMDRAVAERR